MRAIRAAIQPHDNQDKDSVLNSKILEISEVLHKLVEEDGYAPRPALNTAFKKLTSLVQYPYEENIVKTVLEELSTEMLSSLRHLCQQGEMHLERQTTQKILQLNILKLTKSHFLNLSIRDKMRHFEKLIAPYYPYQWAETEISRIIQILYGQEKQTSLQQKNILIYTRGSLPLSHLYWFWSFALHDEKVNIIGVDCDQTRVNLCQAFIEMLENSGLMTPGTIKIKYKPENVPLAEVADLTTLSIAVVKEVFTASNPGQEKRKTLAALFESPVEKIYFTYPEGLTQMLYEPGPIAIPEETDWQPLGCLLPRHSPEPAFPNMPVILRPEEGETLWLSSYCYGRSRKVGI